MGLHPAVSAQRPPDSPHGHVDTGPPLSGSGRLYLKPVLGGNRPAPVKSLNLDPPSYLSQVRQTPRSIKSTHYSRGRWRCLAHWAQTPTSHWARAGAGRQPPRRTLGCLTRSAWGRFTIPWCVLQVHPQLGPPTSPPPRRV